MDARAAALIYEYHVPYLDHLAPLCEVLGIPLIVTDERIEALAREYYEALAVVHVEALLLPEWVASRFEVIFCCTPRDLFDEVFYLAQKLLRKKIHTVWCPHGNSDKGAHVIYMESLRKERAALVYGKQMIDFFQRKQVWESLQEHVVMGNVRFELFKERRPFYEELIDKHIRGRLDPRKRTVLYAPTWVDCEKSSSFFDAIGPLVEMLPDHHQLIVKLHPNLLVYDEFRVEEIVSKYGDRALFLREFPPIYPLLSIVDAYIGDMSSIGYDFLAFDKPLFFLNQNGRDAQEDLGLYLFRCGVEIQPHEYGKIHALIDHHFEMRDMSALRREVYTYAFGHGKPLEVLKQELCGLIQCLSGGKTVT